MFAWLRSKLFGEREDRSWEMQAGRAWYDQPIARPYEVGPSSPVGPFNPAPAVPGVETADGAYEGFLRAEGVARFVTERCGNCAGCRNGMARCVVRDGRPYIDNDPYVIRENELLACPRRCGFRTPFGPALLAHERQGCGVQ